MNSMLEGALSYAEEGYHVFPCRRRSKEPATKNGFKDATTDVATIREWWQREPNYNIGIRTGPGSGVWVLDVDVKDDVDGYDSLAKYRHDIPWNSPRVRTPSGGEHLWFEYDESAEGLRNSVKSIPGLDVRTEGGYVLAPGSVLDDGEYEWANASREPVAAPDSLLRALSAGTRQRGAVDFGKPIPEGQRNAELTRIAGNLTRSGMSATSARECLHIINKNQCQPPLPAHEVDDITLYKNNQVSSSSSLGSSGDSDTPTIRMMRDMRRPTGPRPYIVDGVLFRGFPAAIYGDGGTAKSTLVMHLAQSVALGVDWFGFDTAKTQVLYLDFELDEDEQARRAYEIAQGMGYDEVPEGCGYISGAGHDTQAVFKLALEKCREHGFGLVIVDSAGYAMDGDAESSRDVLRFFRQYEGAFRRAGITMLLVDHQAKGGSYQDKTMFGSVYKSNSARSVFQVEASERGDGYMNLTLRHKKVNFGAMLQPFGVAVRFIKDAFGVVEEVRLSVREMDASELAEERTVNARNRVLMALEDGPMYPAAIADATGLELPTVKNVLTKLRKAREVKDTGNKDANNSHEVRLQVSSSSL